MEEIGKYEEVLKEEIQANSWNPNSMTEGEEKRLKTSMDRNGMLQTVLLYKDSNGKYTIVDGEHRWKTSPKGTKIRSIVIEDKDLEEIKVNLEQKEGIKVDTNEDVLKHLTVIMNKLKGTMTPTKLGDLIESLQVEEAEKANLMLMDEQEIQFYSLVEEIEEEKNKIHEKEFNQDKSEVIKWKVKSVEGLASVILNIKDKQFMVDGEEKELESLTMTVNGKLQSVINCRYKDIIKDEETQSNEEGTGETDTEETAEEE